MWPIQIGSGYCEGAKVYKIKRPISVDQLDEPAHRTARDRSWSWHLPRVNAITCSYFCSFVNRFRQRNVWPCTIIFEDGTEPRNNCRECSFFKFRARYFKWDSSSRHLRRCRNSGGWRCFTRFCVNDLSFNYAIANKLHYAWSHRNWSNMNERKKVAALDLPPIFSHTYTNTYSREYGGWEWWRDWRPPARLETVHDDTWRIGWYHRKY